ncbi:MAG TPA: hypothetical protein VK808_06370 [Bacteroidia bacterium]|jgi:hypothetical protein|nr:hypothetical protein [Bacteroidia bacterium]
MDKTSPKKKKSKTQKNLINLAILGAVIVATYYFTTNNYKMKAVDKNLRPDRVKLITLFTKATRVQSDEQMRIYVDTCQKDMKHCPDEEIDSLKLFIPFYVHFTDVLSAAVIASIKDTGTFDTINIITPECYSIITQMTALTGIPFIKWKQSIFNLAGKAQNTRNSFMDHGNNPANTEYVRNGLRRLKHRNDSIYGVFGERLFAPKKD